MKRTQFGPVLVLSLLTGIIAVASAEAATHNDNLALAAGIGAAMLVLLLAALHRLFMVVLRLTEIRDILRKQGEAEKGKPQSA